MINARMNYMLLPMYHIFQNKKDFIRFLRKNVRNPQNLIYESPAWYAKIKYGYYAGPISSHLQKQALAIKNEKCLTL